jgi:two-component system, OmpR family, lantibiotic biosynthesis sensor histidine kinase NisK/SpaK
MGERLSVYRRRDTMKLKKWFAITYVISMIAPIVFGFFLFNWMQEYDSGREFQDLLEINEKMSHYEDILNDVTLYKKETINPSIILNEDKAIISLALYSREGKLLYSYPQQKYFMKTESKQSLYSNLYQIEKGYGYYSLKKPVFDNEIIVGFYEISVARKDMFKVTNKISLGIIILFALLNLILFLLIMLLLNKKLNKPMNLLIDEMELLARGERKSEISYKSSDEMGIIISRFQKMREEIENAREKIKSHQKEKEYIIASLSHDLKTPLTSIRAYVETVIFNDTLQEEKKKEYLNVALNKSDYMEDMIQELLTYTLLSSERALNFVHVDGDEFFEMLFSDYDETFDNRGLTYKIDIQVEEQYNVDVKNMIRLTDNIVNNAIRHTPKGKKIYLGAFSDRFNIPNWIPVHFNKEIDEWRKDGVVIVIGNEGSFINNKEIENIFKPFYQSDESRNKQKSGFAGLGLSIVKMIVDKSQGKIKVLSIKEKGTFILVWLKKIEE